LITGGCGFIGSNFAIRLVSLGAHVTIIDSMIPDFGENLFNIDPIRKDVDLSFTDIRDPYAMRYVVSDKDLIFNLAGQVSHIDSMENPFQDLAINTSSQLQLLEICRHHNPNVKIVLTSTRQVYGKPQYLPVDEKHPIHPIDVNGIHKLAAENYHSLYYDVYGIQSVILQLTNTYAPRQLVKHNRQGFTGTFIRQAVEGKTIQLFGTGEQRRDFNYIDDVIDALLIVGENPKLVGNTYNLGAPQSYSLKEFVLCLKELCHFEFEIIPFPEENKKIDIGDYYSDYRFFNKETDWSPQVSLNTGLAECVKYYKEMGHYYWD
jgi:UDP-glucose 4-epimerase